MGTITACIKSQKEADCVKLLHDYKCQKMLVFDYMVKYLGTCGNVMRIDKYGNYLVRHEDGKSWWWSEDMIKEVTRRGYRWK